MSRPAVFAWAVPLAGAALLSVLAVSARRRPETAPPALPPSPAPPSRHSEPSPERTADTPTAVATPEHAKAVLKTLRDRAADPSARARAAKEAAALGGDDVVDALAEVLRLDPAYPFRPLLAKALGDVASPRAAPPLIAALRSDVAPDVRLHAARALKRHAASPDVPGALRDATLTDASEHVRLAAFQTYLAARGAEARDFARTVAGLPNAPPPLRAMADRWLAARPE